MTVATNNICTSDKQKYAVFTGVQQAQMAKYTIDNANKAAIEHYSKEFCVKIKESSLSTWKTMYYEEVKRLSKNRQFAESGEVVVTSLPSLKW